MADYIFAPLADMRSQPSETGPLISQLLSGEEVRVLERTGDWALVENVTDRHIGYMQAHIVVPSKPPTHVVTALSVGEAARPERYSELEGFLSFMSQINIVNDHGAFLKTSSGSYITNKGLERIDKFCADPVDTARLFLDVPYVWGGRSYLGIDCSALIQLSFAAYRVKLPRNAGPQCRVLDQDTSPENLRRGDLVFVKGHVMMATGPNTVIHADGRVAMKVREMDLDEALADRGLSRTDATFKACPSSDSWTKKLQKSLGEDRQGNPINYKAFAALAGPDIMS